MESNDKEEGSKIKRLFIRDENNTEDKGFWVGATRDGFSMGPISKNGEDLHLTSYSKDGIHDVHLTSAKGDYRKKETLTRLPDGVLQEKMRDIANEALRKTFRILPADEEIITFNPAILERGKELMQKIFQIVEKGKTAYWDIGGAAIESELQELIRSSENMLVPVKVKDLIQMGIKSGFTKDWKLVIVNDNGAMACNFDGRELDNALDNQEARSLESSTVQPIVEFLKLLGFKQLTDRAKEKGFL